MSGTDLLLFALFAATLLGIALFHHRALPIAVTGLACVIGARLGFTDFDVLHKLHEESLNLANLGGLLLGFALLAIHFERSNVPEHLGEALPRGRLGAFVLLALVFLLSSVLDNIAAALIGATAARKLFSGRVHIGYLAAIVAASNAGGAGSVIGDTTTTMIWIQGSSWLWVLHGGLGAGAALCFFGIFASRQQHALQPLVRSEEKLPPIDWSRLLIVAGILGGAIGANFWLGYPAVGVWAALLLGSLLRAPHWNALGSAALGTVFLLSLVIAASLMPVQALPAPSTQTAFGLGIVSAFFDNIPLTKLALEQNDYDWGLLAYAVGFGGSMLWFGSSAGVALAGQFPEAKSTAKWLRHGWHVAIAYVIGFFTIVWVLGWQAHHLVPPGAGH